MTHLDVYSNIRPHKKQRVSHTISYNKYEIFYFRSYNKNREVSHCIGYKDHLIHHFNSHQNLYHMSLENVMEIMFLKVSIERTERSKHINFFFDFLKTF